MRTAVRSLVCVLLMAAVSTGSAVAEAAPQPVNGPFVVHVNSVSTEPIGDLCLINLNATFSFSGSLVGAFTAPFRLLHFGSCTSPASEVFATRGTYIGSVLGNSGSFSFGFSGAIDPQGHAHADLLILHGSDGLAGLQGTLRLTGQAGVGGTYTGTVAFDS